MMQLECSRRRRSWCPCDKSSFTFARSLGGHFIRHTCSPFCLLMQITNKPITWQQLSASREKDVIETICRNFLKQHQIRNKKKRRALIVTLLTFAAKKLNFMMFLIDISLLSISDMPFDALIQSVMSLLELKKKKGVKAGPGKDVLYLMRWPGVCSTLNQCSTEI